MSRKSIYRTITQQQETLLWKYCFLATLGEHLETFFPKQNKKRENLQNIKSINIKY